MEPDIYGAKVLDELLGNLDYPAFDNQWVLYEATPSLNQFYQIKSISLPNLLPRFETDTLPTGVQYYTKAEFDKEWSITMEENVELSTIKYFSEWSRSIYSNQRFQLSEGNYVKDFYLQLLSPSAISATDIAALTTGRVVNWGVRAANQLVSSALGRLANRASELLTGIISEVGAGVTLLQRAAVSSTGVLNSTFQSLASEGLNQLLTSLDLHSEDVLLTLNMTGTILKSIEKLDLNYEDGSPIQWKITLASDHIQGYVPAFIEGLPFQKTIIDI